MQQLHNIQENVITLNVGGQIYTTSKSTLCSQKESMLAAMFSGHHKLEKMGRTLLTQMANILGLF